MTKDLTSSNVSRQNILNNNYAISVRVKFIVWWCILA